MRQPALSTKRAHTLPEPLPLLRGGELGPVTLAYETWGELSPQRDNVVLVLHALTGDAHAAGRYASDDPRPGWWDPLIGPGRAFDTDRLFVVCSNVLGGCAGSTGPQSEDPRTGRPYGLSFPLVTLQDMVRAQRELLRGLGIERLLAVAGGSIGGQQALEWTIRYPDMVEHALLFGASERIGPQAIALNHVGRRAIMLDPAWRRGAYALGGGPDGGVALARMVGMISYQSQESMWTRFGREPATRPVEGAALPPVFGEPFDVEGYLEYQGSSLSRRFDANSYLYLTRAMDVYDPAEGWGSPEAALSRVRARTLHVGISSDWLYPPADVRALAERLRGLGSAASYQEIDSIHGHDAFLKEWDLMDAVIRPFMADAAPRTVRPRERTVRSEPPSSDRVGTGVVRREGRPSTLGVGP